MLFFQLVNRRYGHASTVLTSNKGFEEWGRILGDEVMAAALLDRLLHRRHIVNIRGNSYRMRRHAELSKAIHPMGGRTNSGLIAGKATPWKALRHMGSCPAPVATLSPQGSFPRRLHRIVTKSRRQNDEGLYPVSSQTTAYPC